MSDSIATKTALDKLPFPSQCPHCESKNLQIVDSEQATIDPVSRTFGIVYYWSCDVCYTAWSQHFIAEIGEVISNELTFE